MHGPTTCQWAYNVGQDPGNGALNARFLHDEEIHPSRNDYVVCRCSTAYAEQYLDTYRGHIGPIYAVRWSPAVPGLFLTASADWSVKLWDQEKVCA